MYISIRTDGGPQVLKKLRTLTPDFNPEVLKKPTIQGSKLLHMEMRLYGPELPNQVYRRTYTLRSGWKMRVIAVPGGYRGYIFNRVKYAPYVQRSGDQANIHKGRWYTDDDIVDQNKDKIIDYYRAALRKAARA